MQTLKENTRIIVVVVIILILLIVVFFGKNSNAFVFLTSLVNGTYQEQLAKLEQVKLSQGNEDADRATPSLPAKKCTFLTTLAPTHVGAIFSEIAWMGDVKDTTNEWLTIKKRSTTSADISGWQIINQNERLKIVLQQGKILSDNKPTFTLARHSKIEGQVPDLVFTGAIKNSNEGLRLFDNNCNLIDEVFANPNWPAGSNGSGSLTTSKTKKPMTRLANLSWQTKGEIVTSEIVTSEAKATPKTTPIEVAKPTCVNINSAPEIELQKIDHVGPKLATKIVQLRNDKPFSSVDELILVSGIGTSTLADIKKQGIVCPI